MDDIYIIILVSVLLIILFFFLVFYHDIMFFFKNLGNISIKTAPSDCPDYWIKYSKHKDSATSEEKYGCYIDAKINPDVVYNGGKCNYINGQRTNFGTMPNYCDIEQRANTSDSLINNLTTATSGIELVDGWQSFFKDIDLPAVISIAPQHKKSWNPGASTPYDAFGVENSDNDKLFISSVQLYKYTAATFNAGARTANFTVVGNEITLKAAQAYTGPSYTITGIQAVIDNTDPIYLDNALTYNDGSTTIEYTADKALLGDIGEYSMNAHSCGITDPTDNSKEIPCPSTWRCEVDDLDVDVSYVLFYVGKYNTGGDFANMPYIVSVYDKLTTSLITKAVSEDVSEIAPNYETITIQQSEGGAATDLHSASDLSTHTNAFIGFLTFRSHPYHPKTNISNTVAGYDMQVFDNLSLCQKRTWAVKNDIKWSGITDNPTLSENCNEDDFFSPVDFNVDFTYSNTGIGSCVKKTLPEAKDHCYLPTFKFTLSDLDHSYGQSGVVGGQVHYYFYRMDPADPVINGSSHGYFKVTDPGTADSDLTADEIDLAYFLNDCSNGYITHHGSGLVINGSTITNFADYKTYYGHDHTYYSSNQNDASFVNLINFINSFGKLDSTDADAVYSDGYGGYTVNPPSSVSDYHPNSCNICTITSDQGTSNLNLSNIFDIN